jgi:hypothetical protein
VSWPRKRSTATSVTHLAEYKHGSTSTRQASALLRPYLPVGWDGYFKTRKAGAHWGLSLNCPICGERPPIELHYGYRRWRWLCVHVSQHV